MAENKKSIVVYSDWIETFEALSDSEAGLLIKHFFRYVNDLNPEYPDRITELSFIPLKNSLKRDLEKWEKKLGDRSYNGRLGNLKRWNEELYNKVINNELTLEQAEILNINRKTSQTSLSDNSDSIATKNIANIADSVNVSVTDSVNVKNKVNNNIEERKLKFSSTLKPYLEKFGKEVLNDFYRYWTEPNQSNTKFRKELEKTWDVERRLDTWVKNDFNKKNNLNNGHTINNQSDKSKDRISTDFSNFGKRPNQ